MATSVLLRLCHRSEDPLVLYQCLLLGAPTAAQVTAVSATRKDSLDLFGLKSGADFVVDRGVQGHFDDTAATVAIVFGAEGAEYPDAALLFRLGIPVMPVVSATTRVEVELPPPLRPLQVLVSDPADLSLRRAASAALQCLRRMGSRFARAQLTLANRAPCVQDCSARVVLSISKRLALIGSERRSRCRWPPWVPGANVPATPAPPAHSRSSQARLRPRTFPQTPRSPSTVALSALH
jgi:hypothetical protein